jgi:hypothetical protein
MGSKMLLLQLFRSAGVLHWVRPQQEQIVLLLALLQVCMGPVLLLLLLLLLLDLLQRWERALPWLGCLLCQQQQPCPAQVTHTLP